MRNKFDVAIIGSGPGGYVAAIRASQLGLKVVIVERADIGGICLNWGCIPTKALLRSAELYEFIKKSSDFGIKIKDYSLDLETIIMRSRSVAEKLSTGVKYLLKKNKVEVVKGHGTLLGDSKINVEEENGKTQTILEAQNIIIATGAKPKQISGLITDRKVVWDYRHALRPKKVPTKLIIVGSGAIGIEFASFYNALGTEVTVVEMQNRILSAEDEEVSSFAKKKFEEKGIKFFVESQFKVIHKDSNTIALLVKTQDEEKKIEAPNILVAAGVIGNTEHLGLTEIGVKTKSGSILTDKYCQTNVEGIFAIGDVTAPPWLAHKASHEGIMVAEILSGQHDVKPIKSENIPGCTYSIPQIASVGLSEGKAIELGHQVKVGNFPFLANGKALAMGEEEGFIKTIFDKETGELLGAHMVGAEVTELIGTYLVGKELETTSAELINTIFPHPTMSEMLHESVLNAEGQTIHY